MNPKTPNLDDLLTIAPVATNKSKIKSNAFMDADIIPKCPASVIFNGRSGSGKSVLLSNLLAKRQFYGGYYDEIYLFSGSPDDIFDDLKIPKKHRFDKPKQWDAKIKKIMDKQQSVIKKKGIHKSPCLLVIFEDIINHGRWMRTSPYFTKLFIANRHWNISTWITTQSWTKVPRVCRINANHVFFFKSTEGETDLLADEYAPAGLKKRDFLKLIAYAVGDDYSFLSINNKLSDRQRYRKCLKEILVPNV